MVSIDHGMSVSEVEALGHKLQDTYSAQIKDFISQIEKMVSASSQHWVGKDGSDFRSWWPAKRAKLTAIADDLHGYGQSALNNAHEQTVASGGSSSGSSGAASPPSGQAPPTAAAAPSHPGVNGPQNISNSSIADIAEKEIAADPHRYHGQNGWNGQGECMVAVSRWLRGAGGNWPGGQSPLDAYKSAGAAPIDLGAVQRGDVLQKYTAGDTSDWEHVHTVLVLGKNADGTLRIAESNYNYKGDMQIVESWSPTAASGLAWSAWRFGQV